MFKQIFLVAILACVVFADESTIPPTTTETPASMLVQYPVDENGEPLPKGSYEWTEGVKAIKYTPMKANPLPDRPIHDSVNSIDDFNNLFNTDKFINKLKPHTVIESNSIDPNEYELIPETSKGFVRHEVKNLPLRESYETEGNRFDWLTGRTSLLNLLQRFFSFYRNRRLQYDPYPITPMAVQPPKPQSKPLFAGLRSWYPRSWFGGWKRSSSAEKQHYRDSILLNENKYMPNYYVWPVNYPNVVQHWPAVAYYQ